jgi:anti-sigma factor RsiW
MKEEMLDKKMPLIADAQTCARADELVDYLYGEAGEAEQLDFKAHLHACHSCRAELAAFGEVRESIGVWREQALHPLLSHAMQPGAAIEQRAIKALPKRSALAALREFFTLSPMWLRGATGFAALLLVTLLIVTALHFFKREESSRAVRQTPPAAQVKEEKSQSFPEQKEEVAVKTPAPNIPASVVTTAKPEPRRTVSRNKTFRPKTNPQPETPVLNNDENLQLREILVAEKESEENVPTLYDLLSESN